MNNCVYKSFRGFLTADDQVQIIYNGTLYSISDPAVAHLSDLSWLHRDPLHEPGVLIILARERKQGKRKQPARVKLAIVR